MIVNVLLLKTTYPCVDIVHAIVQRVSLRLPQPVSVADELGGSPSLGTLALEILAEGRPLVRRTGHHDSWLDTLDVG